MVLAVGHVAEFRLDRCPVADNIVSEHPDGTSRGPALADQHFEGTALAGPVGPQQAEQFAAVDFEIQPIHGDE